MTRHVPTDARLPPPGLPGLDPAWSRIVRVADPDLPGVRRGWHVLDTGASTAQAGTLLCVHGNPTWSYLWRRCLAAPPPGWRVVAPDQLGMGYSERLPAPRTLAQRIADLGGLTAELGIDGPVVAVAHDWGGPISLGWALEHRAQLRGVVLTNTGVQQPPRTAAPALIRLARHPVLRETVCVRTPLFVRGATAVSRPALPREMRAAFAAPYGDAARRAAVADFVADIPLEPNAPSAAALAAIRDRLPALADLPVLLLWGPRDPVFRESHLRDLLARFPHAQVHRYEGASHLVTEDAPAAAADIAAWVGDLARPPARPRGGDRSAEPLWAELDRRANDATPAIVALRSGGARDEIGFAALAARVRHLAAGLAATGVRAGDRVALLVPPGPDLVAVLYACWRAGAVVIVADAGLGLRAMGRALRGAAPGHVVGVPRGLAAAALLRVPGRRVPVRQLDAIERLGRDRPPPPSVGADAEAAVLFTSGATGPPKGVVYGHRELAHQREAVRVTYAITGADRLVAAFAPFVVYGPALGIPSVVPDVDVTRPASLTARALADAVAAGDATVVFAAPGALQNVVATAGELDPPGQRALDGVRLLMSAGAPVPLDLLRALRTVLPHAELHTPYGMTEVLPVTDVRLDEIEDAGCGNGVCVGRPVAGVRVSVSPLDGDGVARDAPSDRRDVTGELCVRAAHAKVRYDRLWATERAASRDPGWHRTGDVGHLDRSGRVWVEGRLAHVVVTPGGVVTPVGVEQRVQAVAGVRAAAAVGVGPRGTQQLVVVIVPEATRGDHRGRLRPHLAAALPDDLGRPLASRRLTATVRAAAGPVPVAAVLVTDRLPVDVRHQSKVDRRRVAAWAERVLAGESARRRP